MAFKIKKGFDMSYNYAFDLETSTSTDDFPITSTYDNSYQSFDTQKMEENSQKIQNILNFEQEPIYTKNNGFLKLLMGNPFSPLIFVFITNLIIKLTILMTAQSEAENIERLSFNLFMFSATFLGIFSLICIKQEMDKREYSQAITGDSNFYEYMAQTIFNKLKKEYSYDDIAEILIENSTMKIDFLKWKASQLIDINIKYKDNPKIKVNDSWILEQAIKESFGKLSQAKVLPATLESANTDYICRETGSIEAKIAKKRRILRGK